MLLDDTLLGLSVLAAKEVGRGCPRPDPEVSDGAVDDGLSDESKESVLVHVIRNKLISIQHDD
jgi:hypothetical protein